MILYILYSEKNLVDPWKSPSSSENKVYYIHPCRRSSSTLAVTNHSYQRRIPIHHTIYTLHTKQLYIYTLKPPILLKIPLNIYTHTHRIQRSSASASTIQLTKLSRSQSLFITDNTRKSSAKEISRELLHRGDGSIKIRRRIYKSRPRRPRRYCARPESSRIPTSKVFAYTGGKWTGEVKKSKRRQEFFFSWKVIRACRCTFCWRCMCFYEGVLGIHFFLLHVFAVYIFNRGDSRNTSYI